VCSLYKTLFSFALFGILSTLAMVVMDVRSRRRQTRGGVYGKMGDDARTSDVKMDSLVGVHSRETSLADSVGGNTGGNGAGHGREVPWEMAARPQQQQQQQPQQQQYSQPQYQSARGDYTTYSPPANVRMHPDDFGNGRRPQQMPYNNGGYGYAGR
jgi:hypothetical protein